MWSAPRTSSSVMAAMATSPTAPTMKGRAPCLKRSLRLVRRPTPAKVKRKAQRLRLPRATSWGLLKPSAAMVGLDEAPRVASSEMRRKPRTNLGNFFQRKAALLSSCAGGGAAGEAFACPVDRVGEDDEADEGVAAGLGEDGVLAGGVGVERAGGGGFGGVVDGEAGPEAVGVVAHVQRVADEREGEERDARRGRGWRRWRWRSLLRRRRWRPAWR